MPRSVKSQLLMDGAAEQVNYIRRVSEVLTPSSVVRRQICSSSCFEALQCWVRRS